MPQRKFIIIILSKRERRNEHPLPLISQHIDTINRTKGNLISSHLTYFYTNSDTHVFNIFGVLT